MEISIVINITLLTIHNNEHYDSMHVTVNIMREQRSVLRIYQFGIAIYFGLIFSYNTQLSPRYCKVNRWCFVIENAVSGLLIY